MSETFRLVHAHRVGILLAAGLTCAAVPAVASASTVGLGAAGPFVVLGSSTVTNTGPSVLNGEPGVAPGPSLVGFGLPAVVNGATHDDDAVAAQAQLDLTTAYNVAAAQPVPAPNNLTGQELGGLTLTAGAYGFSSSGQLTGQLTLDAAGNPNAQFVIEVGTTLTTASASSVRLISGASPCNVYWQIGSSATLGSTTAFQGNLLANATITVNNGVTILGRALARTGQVTLDNDVLDGSMCGASTTPTPTSVPTVAAPVTPPVAPSPVASSPVTQPAPPTSGAAPPPASHSTVPTRRGRATLRRATPRPARLCKAGFTATSVETRDQTRRVQYAGTIAPHPPRCTVSGHVPPTFTSGALLRARVTFRDATHARTLTLPVSRLRGGRRTAAAGARDVHGMIGPHHRALESPGPRRGIVSTGAILLLATVLGCLGSVPGTSPSARAAGMSGGQPS
jgi:hypothetical protein